MTKGSGCVWRIRLQERWSGGKVNVQNRINYDYLYNSIPWRLFWSIDWRMVRFAMQTYICLVSFCCTISRWMPEIRRHMPWEIGLSMSPKISLTARFWPFHSLQGELNWTRWPGTGVLSLPGWTGDLHISPLLNRFPNRYFGLVSNWPRSDPNAIKSYSAAFLSKGFIRRLSLSLIELQRH